MEQSPAKRCATQNGSRTFSQENFHFKSNYLISSRRLIILLTHDTLAIS